MAEAVGTRYQAYADEGYALAIDAERNGLLRGNPNTRVGDFTDRYSASRLKGWLRSEGISEGPTGTVQVNRWLRDPEGSGLYVRPDVRMGSAGVTYDATVGFKPIDSTQIQRFHTYSGGDRVTIVRPGEVGGSYSYVWRW